MGLFSELMSDVACCVVHPGPRQARESQWVVCVPASASDFRFPPNLTQFGPSGVFSGPSVPLPYINIPCLHPISYPESCFPLPSLVSSPFLHTTTTQRVIHCRQRSRLVITHLRCHPFNSNWIPRTPPIVQTCRPSSAMQRVSGSSTSTGICSLNAASGTPKEEELTFGNAFVPVRPHNSHVHTFIPPLIVSCHLTDHSTPGTQVSFVLELSPHSGYRRTDITFFLALFHLFSHQTARIGAMSPGDRFPCGHA